MSILKRECFREAILQRLPYFRSAARAERKGAGVISNEEETTTMTDPNIPVTEDELHAYVDNELPAERRGDVEAWLTTHPECAERVRSWREMAEFAACAL